MKLHIVAVLLMVGLLSSVSFSQVTPDMATGLSPYAAYIPSDIDNVNPANGNIFLKIPLVSFPQRGGKLRLDYYIFYNDKQWQANLYPYYSPTTGALTSINGQWTPAGINQTYSMPSPSGAGVYVARDQFVSYFTNYNQSITQTWGTGSDAYSETTTYITETASTPDGASHYIGDGFKETVSCGPLVPPSSCPNVPSQNEGVLSNTYPATDASGFDQNGHDPDGIFYSGSTVSDTNSNSIVASAQSGWTDTYNRSIPGTASGPGSVQFPNATGTNVSIPMGDLIPGVPAGSVPSQCPAGSSAARIWTVPASSSYGAGTATYYLCYSTLNFQTAFDLSTVMPSQTPPYQPVVQLAISQLGVHQTLMNGLRSRCVWSARGLGLAALSGR